MWPILLKLFSKDALLAARQTKALTSHVENRVLSTPMRVYCSYKLYGSVLPYDRSFARAHQDSEAHRKRVAYRHNQNNSKNTIYHSRTSTINVIVNCPLIK